MEKNAQPNRAALVKLLLQAAVVGGVSGFLVTSPEPWAGYGLAALILVLFGKLAWDIRRALSGR